MSGVHRKNIHKMNAAVDGVHSWIRRAEPVKSGRKMRRTAYLGVFSLIAFLLLGSFGECPAQERINRNHRMAVRYAREGDFETALRLIGRALEETDNAPEVAGDYIVILAWAERYKQAIEAYETFPDTDAVPDYAVKLTARCYRLTGSYDKAIELYNRYLENNGGDRDAVSGLVNTYVDAGDSTAARRYISERIEKSGEGEPWLKTLLAGILFREKRLADAEAVYRQVLQAEPGNTDALTGLGRTLIALQKPHDAQAPLLKVLEREPRNTGALFVLGEAYEAQRDYLSAYAVYENILGFSPGSRAARNLKYRALINLGSYSLAREKLKQSGDSIDAAIYESLLGDEAMTHIRWEEPAEALKMLDKNRAYVQDHAPEGAPLSGSLKKLLLRSYYDGIEAYKLTQDVEGITRAYETLKKINGELPVWVLVNIADTYLYMQQPEKALALFQEAYRRQPDSGTRMSIYYTLMELERFDEAYGILDALDRELPVQIVDRGILKDNWRKAEVAFNRGWWLLYQDRLNEGQKYFERIAVRAPFNSHVLSALGHTYMWRGWPRLALEEFEIVRTIEPEDITGEIGYYYALEENDRGDEAERRAKELLKKYPNNKHVQRLVRHFAVQDKRALTLDAGSVSEDPGVETVYWSAHIDQPVASWRKIFAELYSRDIAQNDFRQFLRRGIIGMDWRLNRDWWFAGAVSADENGGNFGFSSRIVYNPDDYLSFSTFYNHYSITVPLRAWVRGVEAREWTVNAQYRRSERFTGSAGLSLYQISDGNNQWSYIVRTNKALTTRASWKTRISFEGYAGTNSRRDVPYFSPQHIVSAYVTPMVEHMWYRRYDRAFPGRLFCGLGIQKQKQFSAQDVWFIRYEQEIRLSDILAFSLNASFAQRNYDGEDTDVWNFSIRMNTRF